MNLDHLGFYHPLALSPCRASAAQAIAYIASLLRASANGGRSGRISTPCDIDGGWVGKG